MVAFSRESFHDIFLTSELNSRKLNRKLTKSQTTTAWASLPFPIVKIVPEEVDVEDEILSFLELSENSNEQNLGRAETSKREDPKSGIFCRRPIGAISGKNHRQKGFLKFGKARSYSSLPTTPDVEPLSDGQGSFLLSRSLGSTAKDIPSFVWRDLSFRRVALVMSRVVSTEETLQKSKSEEISKTSMSSRSKFSGSSNARVKPPKKEFQPRKFRLQQSHQQSKFKRWWSESFPEMKVDFLSKAASGFGFGDQHARSACPGFDPSPVANCRSALDVHESTHEQSPRDALCYSNAETLKRQDCSLSGVSGVKRAGHAHCDVMVCSAEEIRRLERENHRLKKRVESLTMGRDVKLKSEGKSICGDRIVDNILLVPLSSPFIDFSRGFLSESMLKWKQMKWGLS